jgi:hypothetical protein
MALSMPRLLWESHQNSLVYMGIVSRGNPPDNEPNQSLAAPSNKKLRLDPTIFRHRSVFQWYFQDNKVFVEQYEGLLLFRCVTTAIQPTPV